MCVCGGGCVCVGVWGVCVCACGCVWGVCRICTKEFLDLSFNEAVTYKIHVSISWNGPKFYILKKSEF